MYRPARIVNGQMNQPAKGERAARSISLPEERSVNSNGLLEESAAK